MANSDSLLILGGGGHAQVIADAAKETGRFDRIVLLTPQLAPVEPDPRFEVVVGDIDTSQFPTESWTAIVGIGDGEIRKQRQSETASAGYTITSIIHPSSYVSANANLGSGSLVLARAVVQTNAQLAEGVIVNNNATVDHHCSIGRFSHICPGASLAGGISIGEHCMIGTGASVRPGCNIESQTIVGAGAAVVQDLTSGTWTGVPATRQ